MKNKRPLQLPLYRFFDGSIVDLREVIQIENIWHGDFRYTLRNGDDFSMSSPEDAEHKDEWLELERQDFIDSWRKTVGEHYGARLRHAP